MEREFALSTLAQPHMEPAWKQEVSRRLAAHRNRKGAESAAAAPPQTRSILAPAGPPQAAARVASRYARTPSYSQLQAEEARVAVRAAEIATQVALEAQAAAKDALAEMHAAAQTPARGPAVVESIARTNRCERAQPTGSTEAFTPVPAHAQAEAPAPVPAPQSGAVVTVAGPSQTPAAELRPVTIRWEPDIPARVLGSKPLPREEFELSAEDWWTPAQVSETLRSEPIAVDPEPEHANLIEFPRELVATRRMRPRLAETPFASRPSGEAQLSIFEVDPEAVSIEPAPPQRKPRRGPGRSGRTSNWTRIPRPNGPRNRQRQQPRRAFSWRRWACA